MKKLFVFVVLLIFSCISLATEMKGFMDLRYDDTSDKLYLQLKPNQLNMPFIFQSSLPHGVGSNDIGLDRGQLGDTRLVQFERYGNKIMLKQLNTTYRSSASNAQEIASIDEAFADSILAGFVISLETDDMIELDYTAFLLSDIHSMSARLKASQQGTYKLDHSRSAVFLPRTKSFPLNTEMEAVVTFTGTAEGEFIKQVSPDPNEVSVHMHHSFIQLPDDNYQARTYHPYSGYFKQSHYDYSVPIDKSMEQKYIRRHRLQKQDPQAKMSEAVEPIVYYLDPGIPEPVYSALKEGALWWNQAFEAAGYKDAFQVKRLPEGADPMDVRYNIIQWVHRATRGWSYGYSVFDPRTGEILKGHVTLGSLRVRQDFLIALGLTSPFESEDTDTSLQLEMALNRIKQLSAHEVGHTIGIAHNFAASENNRASVMDYPHPLIEIKDGKLDLSNAYDDGIGEWDKYVVRYGYSDFPSGVDEEAALADLLADAKAKFLFKSDPDARSASMPSSDGHLWDNGSDPIKAYEHMLEVRRIALDKFGPNSLPFGEDYSSLQERLVPIYYAHRYQFDALVKQIGGLRYDYSLKASTDKHAIVEIINADTQRKALSLVLQSARQDLLALPERISKLIPPKIYGSERTRESAPSRMGIAFDPLTLAEAAAANSINKLLNAQRLNRVHYQALVDDKQLSIEELLSEVTEYWLDGVLKKGISERVGLISLAQMFTLLDDKTLSPEVRVAIEGTLITLENTLSKHRSIRAKVLSRHLKNYWQTGRFELEISPLRLPPGSPI